MSCELLMSQAPIKKILFSERAWLGLLLRSVQICKKCTILGNLKTITLERKKEIRQMTPFFFMYFLSFNCLWYWFLYLKIVKIHFHGVLLSSILVCKIPEFWRCKLWNQNFVSFGSGNMHIKACIHYFSLFLKEKCISLLFQTNYIEKKFNLELIFLTIVSALELPSAACLLKTSCFEK